MTKYVRMRIWRTAEYVKFILQLRVKIYSLYSEWEIHFIRVKSYSNLRDSVVTLPFEWNFTWRNLDASSLQQQNYVHEWLGLGVRYIGGGTGTVADHVRENRKQVDNYRAIENYMYLSYTILKPCFFYQDKQNFSKM